MNIKFIKTIIIDNKEKLQVYTIDGVFIIWNNMEEKNVNGILKHYKDKQEAYKTIEYMYNEYNLEYIRNKEVYKDLLF